MTYLFYNDSQLHQQAQYYCKQYGLIAIKNMMEITTDSDFLLELNSQGLQLHNLLLPRQHPLSIDFCTGKYAYRRQFGGGKSQLIAKAFALHKGIRPRVLDTTAGLARDSFVLASLGCSVHMLERSAPVAALIDNALQRAANCPDIVDIVQRLSLQHCNSISYLHNQLEDKTKQPDMIYMDPMFPQKKGKALVKKEMQVLQQIIGADEDAEKLLILARELAQYRVIVKRPAKAPFLANQKPDLQIASKKQRFDIYINRGISR